MLLKINRRLVLASKSPRRLQLLRQIGLELEVIPSMINEEEITDSSIIELIQKLAEAKGRSISGKVEDGIIISADTAVVLGNRLLGKPAGRDEAINMLGELSGNMHTVLTAFHILSTPSSNSITGHEQTKVFFRTLSESEIISYIDTAKPLDKAGAYGIQDAGAIFIQKIEGCYNNVMGFPLTRFYETMIDPENRKRLSLDN